MCGVHMGIALRSGYIRMAKQFLNIPQTGTPLEQVRCERVPQTVRTNLKFRAGLDDIMAHQPSDTAG